MSVLDDRVICGLIRQAWQESEPGTARAHEEGGFILRNADGSLSVERWPRGSQDEILVPEHAGGKRHGLTIVATFHTHPNPGPNFLQAPGPADIMNVLNDTDLDHSDYEGEFVLASE